MEQEVIESVETVEEQDQVLELPLNLLDHVGGGHATTNNRL